MKVEDIIRCLEEALNRDECDCISKNIHCLVLHKTIEPTSFNAYTKHTYILYDVINNLKLRLLTLNYVGKNEKSKEEYLKDCLDKLFVEGLMRFIGTHFNNIKECNYEAIKV